MRFIRNLWYSLVYLLAMIGLYHVLSVKSSCDRNNLLLRRKMTLAECFVR